MHCLTISRAKLNILGIFSKRFKDFFVPLSRNRTNQEIL